MRIYKRTFSKPLPEGAKILRRKNGKFAKFKDSKGHMQEERLTKSGDKILCDTSHWHIRFEDNLSIRRELKAYTYEQATKDLSVKIQKLLNYKANNQPLDSELQKDIEQLPVRIRDELVGFGLLSGKSTATGKLLTEHIEDFKDYLTKKERGQRHIKAVTWTLKRIFRDCDFTTWTNISAEVLKNYLDDQRNSGKGISKGTYNNVLKMIKHFCRWVVKKQKQDGNLSATSPVEYLDCLDNQQTDSRHPRRALELEDFRRFLDAALMGPEKLGLTGRQRNFVYRFAVETAMRKIDFNRLRVRDCDFDKNKINIKADRIKNKQKSDIYLRSTTAIELKQYCANKLPDAKVFHLPTKPEDMVKFDLANTAVKDSKGKVIVPAIPYRDKDGNYFDFHSIRHQSASIFGMNPETSEAVRQKLTRHKSPEMARHYTHVFEIQQRQAVDTLPDLMQPSTQTQTQIKTGTDGEILPNSCFLDDQIRPDMAQDSKVKKIKAASTAKNRIISEQCNVELCPTHFCETPL
ncbi:MAG: tyrosine-type recombinase/integrase [Planctomycetes bacterium]|nr:tyrosine-type recombinase/integrase [Planctomycetota bacterium]